MIPGTPAWAVAAASAAALDAELRARAADAVANRPAAVTADPWRQAFHIQPPVGLLNDPNGLVQLDGVYHLCFQWHPFAPKHALKFWAYQTSTDLVHWTEQPLALAPSDPFDKNGCYSGSGIVHDGAVQFLYTGNVRGDAGERYPFQNLAAVGADGQVTKHPANPVVAPIEGYTGHIRDPKVWLEDGTYWMVLGAQTEDLHGTVLLLRSTDLVSWELVGELAGGSAEPYGYMWECPDLIRMDGGDVLIISPQLDHGDSAPQRFEDISVYSIGTVDLAAPRFTGGDFQRVDAGPDFYAPQTFVDDTGRTIMYGWMGMPDHDGQPDIAVKHPTVANGWVHCLTVPRELRIDAGTLIALPVAELEVLRGDPVTVTGVAVAAGTSTSVAGVSGTALDLLVTARCAEGAAVALRLRDGASGHPVVLTLDPGAGTATLDRTQLGTGEGGVSVGSFRAGDQVDARILLDHSSIEVFIDGGRLVMSARIYPEANDDLIAVEAFGADATVDVTAYPMASA